MSNCKQNLQTLKELFLIYEKSSGQVVSLDKSHIFFGPSLSASSISSLLQIWTLSKGHFPMNYLGVPIFKGVPKRIYFQKMADKIISKIELLARRQNFYGWATLSDKIYYWELFHSQFHDL